MSVRFQSTGIRPRLAAAGEIERAVCRVDGLVGVSGDILALTALIADREWWVKKAEAYEIALHEIAVQSAKEMRESSGERLSRDDRAALVLMDVFAKAEGALALLPAPIERA